MEEQLVKEMLENCGINTDKAIQCKTYGSYLYCLDKNDGNIYVFPKQKTEINKIPKSVLEAFLKEKYDAEIVFKETK